jgi:hypothetical protein
MDKARAHSTREERHIDEYEHRKMRKLIIRVADRSDARAC